jgi:hypothetical protein
MSRVTPSPITGDHKRRNLARAKAKSFPSPAGDSLQLFRKSKLSPTATEHFADPTEHFAAMTREETHIVCFSAKKSQERLLAAPHLQQKLL